MKRPARNTSDSFCELVVNEISKKKIKTNQEIAKLFQMAPTGWLLVRDKKLPDFTIAPIRKRNGWIRSITRICDALGLDLEACLKACSLEKDERIIQQGRQLGQDQKITEKDLAALSEVIKRTQRPIPLAFALEYLKLLHPQQ